MQWMRLIFLMCWLISTLMGCASSSVSRSAANQVDSAYQQSNAMVTSAGDSAPSESFQNASQTTQGAIIGGAAGAVAGGVSGVVGLLPGATGGAVLGGVLGAYIDHHTNIVDRLENRGVNVIILGDHVMLVLPSTTIFQAQTPEIRPQAYSTLDLIAKLISGFHTLSVKVAAYTNDTGDDRVNCVVSQQQANSVVKYLWPRVNTRVLSGMGFGGTHLIARNNLTFEQGANYRIEITLEKLPI